MRQHVQQKLLVMPYPDPQITQNFVHSVLARYKQEKVVKHRYSYFMVSVIPMLLSLMHLLSFRHVLLRLH